MIGKGFRDPQISGMENWNEPEINTALSRKVSRTDIDIDKQASVLKV